MQAIHVGFVRERVAIDEIHATARRAAGDAVRFIGIALADLRADRGCGFVDQIVRHEQPPAELRIARVFKGEIRLHRRHTIPHREHADLRRDVFDSHFRPQLVETELGGEGLSQRQRNIEHEAAALGLGRFRHQKIGDDLALRRQQRAEPAQSRTDKLDVRGHEVVQEFAGILAADPDHAAIRQKRCFHEVFSGFLEVLWGNFPVGCYMGT